MKMIHQQRVMFALCLPQILGVKLANLIEGQAFCCSVQMDGFFVFIWWKARVWHK